MYRKSKRYKKVSAYTFSLMAIVITLLAGIPSCTNQEAQSEHFNNNSTGADRDHTEVHQEDTLKINSSELRDSLQDQ